MSSQDSANREDKSPDFYELAGRFVLYDATEASGLAFTSEEMLLPCQSWSSCSECRQPRTLSSRQPGCSTIASKIQ
eukprot:scaffold389_cov211-Alexandrium_tamarense.AAC.5